MYHVYIIENADDKLYVGITKDLNKRLHCHNTNQGAEFTKDGKNFRVVFSEMYKNLSEARRREIQIKKWRRNKKEFLIKRFFSGLSTKLT